MRRISLKSLTSGLWLAASCRHLCMILSVAVIIGCCAGANPVGTDILPDSIDASSTLSVDGPDEPIQVREDAYLLIGGLTLDQIKQAKKDGLFDLTVYPRKGVSVKASYDWLNDLLELRFEARQPGSYLVKLHLVRDGKLEIAATEVFVEGDEPEPDPDPSPDPEPQPTPGPKKVIIFSESSTRTLNQAKMLSQLRQSNANALILDPKPDTNVPTELAGLKAKVESGISYPAVAITDNDFNAIAIVRLPDNWEDLKTALKKHGVSP